MDTELTLEDFYKMADEKKEIPFKMLPKEIQYQFIENEMFQHYVEDYISEEELDAIKMIGEKTQYDTEIDFEIRIKIGRTSCRCTYQKVVTDLDLKTLNQKLLRLTNKLNDMVDAVTMLENVQNQMLQNQNFDRFRNSNEESNSVTIEERNVVV